MPGRDSTCLCKHFGGAKALFCYVNHQVNSSAVWRRAKPCKIFHLGAMSPVPPAGMCLLSTKHERGNFHNECGQVNMQRKLKTNKQTIALLDIQLIM